MSTIFNPKKQKSERKVGKLSEGNYQKLVEAVVKLISSR